MTARRSSPVTEKTSAVKGKRQPETNVFISPAWVEKNRGPENLFMGYSTLVLSYCVGGCWYWRAKICGAALLLRLELLYSQQQLA